LTNDNNKIKFVVAFITNIIKGDKMEWTIIGLNILYAVIGVVLMFLSYKVFDLLSPKINF